MTIILDAFFNNKLQEASKLFLFSVNCHKGTKDAKILLHLVCHLDEGKIT